MIDSFSGQYGFLSNFYPCLVIGIDNKQYSSVEHAFQAAKCLDIADCELIRSATSPGDAKRLGRRIRIRPDWEDVKIMIMMQLLDNKFSNGQLRLLLLSTGDEGLVEGNTWGDIFWGVCNGKGENWLGEILMSVRKNL